MHSALNKTDDASADAPTHTRSQVWLPGSSTTNGTKAEVSR